MFYDGKTVLITGGTGFVGMHIVKELLKQNANIVVPIHHRPSMIDDNRISTINADLTRQEDCLKVSKDVDYIFHAAGDVASAGVVTENLMRAITTNLIITSQMLQAAWEENVDRMLIFSSSTGYPVTNYPIKEEEMWNGPTHPTYFGYGWMRRYLERIGEFVAFTSNVKISIVRPTAIYGRWDNSGHVIPSLIKRAIKKENPFIVWGTGEEIRDFLHVSDLARGCLLMLEKCANCDPVNIGYGKSVTIKEIVNIILKVTNHKDADIIFDSSKPGTIPIRIVDTTKAKRLLNFEPEIILEDGLKDIVDWYITKNE